MKRLLFFLFMIGGILASTYVVLFIDGFDVGMKELEEIFKTLTDGSLFKSGLNAMTVQTYGLLVFLLVNAILLITFVLMFLLNGGKLGRVRQFYTISIWFFIGALVYTIGIGYFVYDVSGASGIMDTLKDLPWKHYIPFGASLVLLIVAISFRKSES